MFRELAIAMLRSVEEFVDALGGSGAAAGIAGVGASAVSNWKAHGFIPAEYFLRFARAAADRGLAFDPVKVFGFKQEVA
jgi:hypothetical protein